MARVPGAVRHLALNADGLGVRLGLGRRRDALGRLVRALVEPAAVVGLGRGAGRRRALGAGAATGIELSGVADGLDGHAGDAGGSGEGKSEEAGELHGCLWWVERLGVFWVLERELVLSVKGESVRVEDDDDDEERLFLSVVFWMVVEMF